MKNIYDNGSLMLGQVSEISKYNDNLLENRGIEVETYLELKKELDELNKDDIVAINYANGMGLSIEKWKQRDILESEWN